MQRNMCLRCEDRLMLLYFKYCNVAVLLAISDCVVPALSAAAAAAIVSCVMNAPAGVLVARFKTTSFAFKLIASLSCNIATSYGFHIMAMYEGTGAFNEIGWTLFESNIDYTNSNGLWTHMLTYGYMLMKYCTKMCYIVTSFMPVCR